MLLYFSHVKIQSEGTLYFQQQLCLIISQCNLCFGPRPCNWDVGGYLKDTLFYMVVFGVR